MAPLDIVNESDESRAVKILAKPVISQSLIIVIVCIYQYIYKSSLSSGPITGVAYVVVLV